MRGRAGRTLAVVLISITFARVCWDRVASAAFLHVGLDVAATAAESQPSPAVSSSAGENTFGRRELSVASGAVLAWVGGSREARAGFFDEPDGSSTYGTIEPDGIRTMLKPLTVDNLDVFTDAGSGNGNVVLQVYATTQAKKIKGIEFVKDRHQQALRNFDRYKEYRQSPMDPSREIALVESDICKEDFSDSTIVFASSPCYSKRVMECLKAACEPNSKLKYLITSQPLPPTSMRYLGDITDVETTWEERSRYRVYSNVPGVALPSMDVVDQADGKDPLRITQGDVICR